MNNIAWLIIACEIGFWVFILVGLVTRYVLKKKKLGLFFLSLTPLIDLLLLIATAYDLNQGATATKVHGIAAIYIGVSIAYGKNMISWADKQFTYYVLKQGTKPEKLYGYEHARQEVKGALKHVLAFIIGASFLIGLIYFINDPNRTKSLLTILQIRGIVLAIDFVYAASYFIWPRQQKSNSLYK